MAPSSGMTFCNRSRGLLGLEEAHRAAPPAVAAGLDASMSAVKRVLEEQAKSCLDFA
jgi:hypothetical protein